MKYAKKKIVLFEWVICNNVTCKTLKHLHIVELIILAVWDCTDGMHKLKVQFETLKCNI